MPYRDMKQDERALGPGWLEEWVYSLVKAHAPKPAHPSVQVNEIASMERLLAMEPPLCQRCAKPVQRITAERDDFGRQLAIWVECHGEHERRAIDGRLIALASARHDSRVELVDAIYKPYFTSFRPTY